MTLKALKNWLQCDKCVFILSMLLTFFVLRISLLISPDSDFNLGPYNIHHLFTGLVILTVTGIPLAVGNLQIKRWIWVAGFSTGLSMSLDELVYLIATDGSNSAYLTPISFWGGLIAVMVAAIIALFVPNSKISHNKKGRH